MSVSKWALDPTHSELQFKVKHLMITNVTGNFSGLQAEIESESEEFKNTKIAFSADVNTINTSNEQRDAHLKSEDFFNAPVFPELKFTSDSFDATSGKVTGNLTIKDVTRPVTLNVEYSGTNTDPWGNVKAGFSLEGKINRTDFGLTWNAALETGGVLVSEDVKIFAEVQFVKHA